ncbi:hypothetical protein [Marinobacter mangrovi]|uniref:hypothetical protein n=1 Tax=Marinobacter mangrovi TaxID=2803918 RepID=UPI001932DFF1|nr:hypothetical protein [Marinobacter mangrovi]
MMQKYIMKTNREQQWQAIEALMKDHGATRKNISSCHKYFFDGIDLGGNFSLVDKFVFYPDPSFDGWQQLLDEGVGGPISDADFKTLNQYLCGQLADYFFSIEDQNYYFQATFGDVYDSERKFPLRINNESSFRKIVLTENAIFFILVNRFSRWLKGKEKVEQGVLRFNYKYFETLLSVVEKTPFSDKEELPDETIDGSVRPKILRAGIKTILKFGVMENGYGIDDVRFSAARRVTEIMMDHASELADLKLFYERAIANAARN